MENDLTASLVSIATTEGTAALVAATDEYPFSRIGGFSKQEEVLRRWLLGNAIYVPERNPLGGAALVTGFRGVGKTTLVNKVLFDVSLAALHSLQFREERHLVADDRLWGPFSHKEVQAALKRIGDRPKATDRPRLYVPIRINVSNGIDQHELMRRTLRRTYLTLTRYQIGHFLPELMRRVRLAYIRSLGGVEIEVSRKIQESLGVKLEKLSTLEVTANQELEFAETIKLVTTSLSVEEGEDELLDIGHDLLGSSIGKRPGIIDGVRGVGKSVADTFARVSTFLGGANGKQVHLVYILDELDKLDATTTTSAEVADRIGIDAEMTSYERSTGGLSFFQQKSRMPITGTVTVPRPSIGQVTDQKLREAIDVIRQLKILFSSRDISAVAIAGAKTEETWQDEIATPEFTLRSIFGAHVYIPHLDQKAIKAILRNADGATADNEAALAAVWTRGRFKSLLRMLPILAASRNDPSALADEFPLRARAAAEKLGKGWGSISAQSIPMPSEETLPRKIEDSESIEDLVTALAPHLPGTRHNDFGLDLLRTLLTCCLTEMMAPTADVSNNLAILRRQLGRFVAPDVSPLVLTRLAKILAWRSVAGRQRPSSRKS